MSQANILHTKRNKEHERTIFVDTVQWQNIVLTMKFHCQ